MLNRTEDDYIEVYQKQHPMTYNVAPSLVRMLFFDTQFALYAKIFMKSEKCLIFDDSDKQYL